MAEIGRFYDQLKRQGQSVDRYEELLSESLERDVDFDRGAARMLQQTHFLAAVFRAYERQLADRSLVDEHALREHLIRTAPADPIRHIVVTVGDWIADADGLCRADFDLLARLPELAAIDVVATEGSLRSGLHERIRDWLPGIEEVNQAAGDPGWRVGSSLPALLAPAGSNGRPLFTHRDREEELIAIARAVKTEGTGAARLDRVGIVVKRPLPYLYLARQVFADAAIPYQTLDSLPLASEPFAAALDLVLDFVTSRFTRASSMALLGSPHFDLRGSQTESPPIDRDATIAVDRVLREARYLGELEQLRAVAEGNRGDHAPVGAALKSLVAAAEALQPLLEPAAAADHLDRLALFLTSFVRMTDSDDRSVAVRSAIIRIITFLARAHAAHGRGAVTIEDLIPDLKRWIEEETLGAEGSNAGLQLVDDRAARYGDFDALFVVGLIDGEWPEPHRPNIFHPSGLLAALGWPSEADRRGAATAAFLDLIRSPARRGALSVFTLDDEALVEPSSLLDDPSRLGMPILEIETDATVRLFPDDALSLSPLHLDCLDQPARTWADLRVGRTEWSDGRYHGDTGATPLRPLSVSAIETYLSCPFKFFARSVLRLPEEVDDDELMDPKKRGILVHEVFQRFFARWQADGHGAITSENLDRARVLFADVVEEAVGALPEADAALERTRLLGSPVAEGLAEAVFRMEAERPVPVLHRLLEYPLDGTFHFDGGGAGPREVALRGTADRLDLLADGTIRLIDYKLSSAPPKSRSVQLPVYGTCAEQRLQNHRGRRWTLGEAAYILFRGAKRVVPLFTARADRDEVLRSAHRKLIEVIERIERGEFPPAPDDVFLCGFCHYASVCRKDYVGDV
jgi:RecB family exonuclease